MTWGGVEGHYDSRMQEIMRLLDFAPEGIKSLLDIGMGRGQISERFASKGVQVTGTGLEFASYGVKAEDWAKKGIKVVECPVETMPFEDDSFDAAVASHILEHVPNMRNALQEIRRVLKPGGWLLLFIPHYEDSTTAGHINTGWNIGQLVYVLLLNGFNVKNGKFIRYGYSLCAYVQKKDIKLPELRCDRGDVQILDDSGLLPFKIMPRSNGDRDAFNGEIQSINWPGAEELIEEYNKKLNTRWQSKVADSMASFTLKVLGKAHAYGLANRILRKGGSFNPDKVYEI